MTDDLPYDARVLVAVITRPKDLDLARSAGWYRVPLRRAPAGLSADYLAFYQTAAFAANRWAVRYVAEILQVSLVERLALLPDEPTHPRAAERYYRFALGPLMELPRPIPSRRLRRVTFITTSYGQLLRAADLTDLWHPPEGTLAATDVWGAGIGRR